MHYKMVLLKHNNMNITNHIGEDPRSTAYVILHDTSLFDTTPREKFSGSSRSNLISNDTLKPKWWLQNQSLQSPYDRNRMEWGENESDASGAVVINATSPPHIANYVDDADQESNARLTLLAKKYASERTCLSREDNARLEMINQRMNRSYPRYSTKDWELLDEAEILLSEFPGTSGQ